MEVFDVFADRQTTFTESSTNRPANLAASAATCVVIGLRWEELDGHKALELQVARLVHDTHSTGADVSTIS